MNLAATMSLSAGQFLGPLAASRAAISGVKGVLMELAAPLAGLASIAGAMEGLKRSFDLGSSMTDLSNRTGESVSNLLVLRKAYEDAGMSAEAVGPSLNLMQKALAGVNEEGLPTNATFERLGLSMDKLQKMPGLQQLQIIGEKLRSIENPAQRAQLAMSIFGRSGGQMLALLNDKGALGEAAANVGKQAQILEKNAKLFDFVSDSLHGIGTKLSGFFVGVADKVAPVLAPLLEEFNKLDLSGLGQQIGNIFAVLAEAFKEGRLGELLSLSLQVGAMKGINFLLNAIRASANVLQEALGQALEVMSHGSFWSAVREALIATFSGISAALLNAFAEPIRALQAGLTTVFEKTGEVFGTKLGGILKPFLRFMIPGAALMVDQLSSPGMKARSYEQNLKDTPTFFGTNEGDLKGVADAAWKLAREKLREAIGGISWDAVRDTFTKALQAKGFFGEKLEEAMRVLRLSYNDLLKNVEKASALVKGKYKNAPAGEGGDLNHPISLPKFEAASNLEKLGAVFGGSSGGQPQLAAVKRTAENTSKIAAVIARIEQHLPAMPAHSGPAYTA